jgi:hypothetical protein
MRRRMCDKQTTLEKYYTNYYSFLVLISLLSRKMFLKKILTARQGHMIWQIRKLQTTKQKIFWDSLTYFLNLSFKIKCFLFFGEW